MDQSFCFDPSAVSAESLAEQFPDLGLFLAEDVVEWRRKNGAFPDQATLTGELGVPADLAARLSAGAASADRPAANDVEAPPRSEVEAPAAYDVEAPAEPAEVEEAPAASAVSGPSIRVAAPSVVRLPPLPAVVPESAATPARTEEPAPAVTHVASPPPRRPVAILAALLVVNLAVIGVAGASYVEQRRARKPIAAMGAEVGSLKAEQTTARERDADVQARITETQHKLAEQARALAETKARVAAAEARLRDDERKRRDRDAEEAQAAAALGSRVKRLEKQTYKLDEALKLIDAVSASP
ncbi:MAG: hypothetical protein JWP97_2557 [Labilithrix sp.]|nr:hypothetical protein [Labilithrix sp.]